MENKLKIALTFSGGGVSCRDFSFGSLVISAYNKSRRVYIIGTRCCSVYHIRRDNNRITLYAWTDPW